MRHAVGDQLEVRVLPGEGIDRGWSVALRRDPFGECTETSGGPLIDGPEELAVGTCPLGQLVIAPQEFLTHGIDAARGTLPVCPVEPRPEPWRDVEGVVPVLRLDQNVRVHEVHHGAPSWSASPSNVLCFVVPSSWYASR